MARRKGYGTLVKRGEFWALRWTVDGRQVQERTTFRVSVKADRKRAEELLEKRTEIFRLKSKDDQLALLIQHRESIQTKMTRLQHEALPKEKPLTLGNLQQAWLESPRRRDSSEKQTAIYCQQLQAFVRWAGEGVDMRAVDDDLAEKYAAHLAKNFSPNSYNKNLNALALIWRAFVRTNGIQNPWLSLPRKRLDSHVRRALTKEEIDKLIDTATGEYKALITIVANTGLRLGDAVNLKWSDFDENAILRVRTSKTNTLVVLPCKSLVSRLKGILAHSADEGLVLPALAAQYAHNDAKLSREISKIFAAAGIETSVQEKSWGRKRPDATMHSIRHWFVSDALLRGIPAPIVRALVGHSTQAMQDRYSHIGEEAIIAAFERAGM